MARRDRRSECLHLAGPLVVASDDHRASPPGWTGIIEVCGRAVVVCPSTSADRVAARLAGLTAEQVIQPSVVDALLEPDDTLGPALLFYGRPTWRPQR